MLPRKQVPQRPKIRSRRDAHGRGQQGRQSKHAAFSCAACSTSTVLSVTALHVPKAKQALSVSASRRFLHFSVMVKWGEKTAALLPRYRLSMGSAMHRGGTEGEVAGGRFMDAALNRTSRKEEACNVCRGRTIHVPMTECNEYLSKGGGQDWHAAGQGGMGAWKTDAG